MLNGGVSTAACPAVNPIELVMEALSEVQARFYKDFPPHPEESRCGDMFTESSRTHAQAKSLWT